LQGVLYALRIVRLRLKEPAARMTNIERAVFEKSGLENP
jgi:hypothetical protein